MSPIGWLPILSGSSAGGVIDVNLNIVWATVDRLLDGFLALLPLLAAALVVFVLLLFVARGVGRWPSARSRGRPTAARRPLSGGCSMSACWHWRC